MILTWRTFILLIVIFSSVQFITCPDTETTTSNAVQTSTGTSAAKQYATVKNNDKLQSTVQESSKTGYNCVLLKPLRWLVTEPIKYLWNYMRATISIIGNTIHRSAS